jgi:hypothetical protein
MTLVIAFIGAQGAVMAGDMREITFQGDDSRIKQLEAELYDGSIVTDADLERRASEIGVAIWVRDDKNKVSRRDGILIGEVSESEGENVRKRRLYATAGRYAIAEIVDSSLRITHQGRATNFVVLGNDITKQIAHQCIRDMWDNGTLQDAMRIILLAMQMASTVTASVSRTFMVVHTASRADLTGAIQQDSQGKLDCQEGS